jgi:uncharacterized LabA/DUF88 family protein
MEKLVIFNDYANVEAGFQQFGPDLDEQHLLDYLSEGRFLVEAHAFVPIDPRNPHGRDATIEELWRVGYLVHDKIGTPVGDGYRCNLDVEMTLELMRTAEIVKPDIIVLISGDKDFIPVILELRRRGIRVEVAALPTINAAREVMLKASGFIDLERYHRERGVTPHLCVPAPGTPCDPEASGDHPEEDAPGENPEGVDGLPASASRPTPPWSWQPPRA